MWKQEKCSIERLAGEYDLLMHTSLIFYQEMKAKGKAMFDYAVSISL
jgi:hypothetical protein